MKRGLKKTKWVLILGLAVATMSMGVHAQSTVADVVEFSDIINRNNAQDISKLPKMDRDIVIMENVLGDLFKSRSSFNSSSRTKGLYIPNNGVIFSVGGNGMFRGNQYVGWGELEEIVVGQSVAQSSSSSKDYSKEDLDKLNEEKKEKMVLQAKTFLADYGSLLGELKDNERIQVSVNYSLHVQSTSRKIEGQFALVSSSRNENKRRLTAEISVRDLKAYASGSINQNQAFSRIKVEHYDNSGDEMIDAKILAGIFNDLFKVTYDGYLSRSGSTSWTYFEGFGLMYNMNLSSRSNRYSLATRDGVQVVTNGEKTLTADDFYSDIKKKYPEFEAMVKENLVKYGRTLRSLKANEVVILNLGISANKLSELPKSIQFMISKSDIDAFTKGSKSLKQVMDNVTLRTLKASLAGGLQYYSPSPEVEGLISYPSTRPAGERVYSTDRASVASVRERSRVADRDRAVSRRGN